MTVKQSSFTVETRGRSLVSITDTIRDFVQQSDTQHGLLHLWIQHTSASLIVTENADPDVLRDHETYLSSLVPDGNPSFRHDAEGPDDMAAHIRSILTQTSLTIPVQKGRMALGTWQGIFLWEHRTSPHRRTIIASVLGN